MAMGGLLPLPFLDKESISDQDLNLFDLLVGGLRYSENLNFFVNRNLHWFGLFLGIHGTIQSRVRCSSKPSVKFTTTAAGAAAHDQASSGSSSATVDAAAASACLSPAHAGARALDIVSVLACMWRQ